MNLEKILETKNILSVQEILSDMNIVDIAEELEDLDEDDAIDAVKIFRMLPKDKAADVFAYLSSDMQEKIVNDITDREISGIIEDLFLDDAVDFIEEMPANVVIRVLENVTPGKRELINQLLKYPEDSAGSIMTVEYVSLKEDWLVKDAFKHIRETGLDKETIYTCYVTDYQKHLLGFVTARALMLADPEESIKSILHTATVFAKTTEDKENLSNDFRKYGILAMPVVDNENRLVGIVTIDDAIVVQEEEATEDFEIMAAISPTDEPYLKMGVFELTKKRVVWLLLLMLSATVTGSIISRFEDALAVLPALVIFIPMLMDTGGNAGSQSATLIIRGMALDEIEISDIWAVVWKEARVAILCGITLFVVNFARLLITGQSVTMALTVSISLICTVILAKSVGCMLPMLAKKFGMDPAVMASPVITTVVDAGSLLIYFGLAKMILNI
ncbi:MAG: magnesium transporter [Clostridioides sp.]|nr:magnesium transporter [Clostridioides sp.]